MRRRAASAIGARDFYARVEAVRAAIEQLAGVPAEGPKDVAVEV
jgi:hypothetical protein